MKTVKIVHYNKKFTEFTHSLDERIVYFTKRESAKSNVKFLHNKSYVGYGRKQWELMRKVENSGVNAVTICGRLYFLMTLI